MQSSLPSYACRRCLCCFLLQQPGEADGLEGFGEHKRNAAKRSRLDELLAAIFLLVRLQSTKVLNALHQGVEYSFLGHRLLMRLHVLLHRASEVKHLLRCSP